ncbi:MAG: (2Fe-2S)-binding protein [Hyphomicrobium sp.]
MIVCSCNVISDRDIDVAVIDIMGAPNAPIPTPGVVFRHLSKRMNCCKCAPVAVATIYAAMDRLAAGTRVCPFILAEARAKLVRLEERRQRRETLRTEWLSQGHQRVA